MCQRRWLGFPIKYLFHYMTFSTNKCICPHFDMHLIPPLIMATIRARGSFVPFTLPLEDDGHVSVSKDLLGLRFNFRIEAIYVE